jgi:ABC-type nitrate/sulfonate/bicarbonate transport system substrate-binding protein
MPRVCRALFPIFVISQTLPLMAIALLAGRGGFDTVTLGTSAYEALANGSVNFTHEVSTREGVNSVLPGRPQRAFGYSDFGVPDQHTTFLGANTSWLSDNAESTRAFVQAAQLGYAFAAGNPEEATDMLIAETAGMLSNPKLVRALMQALVDGGYLQDPGWLVGWLA